MATSSRRRLDRPSDPADNHYIASIFRIDRRVRSPGASSQRFFPGLHLFVDGARCTQGPERGHERKTGSELRVSALRGKDK